MGSHRHHSKEGDDSDSRGQDERETGTVIPDTVENVLILTFQTHGEVVGVWLYCGGHCSRGKCSCVLWVSQEENNTKQVLTESF